MICSNCRTLNFRDYKYCRECGQPLTVCARQQPLGLDVTQREMDPGHPQDAQIQALLDSAFTAFGEGRLPDARATCQSALALRPDSTAAHSLLGLVCEREGKTVEAIHQFQVVLELNPNSQADREHLERLQRRLPSKRSKSWRTPARSAGTQPLLVGSIAAAVVLAGGLWIVADLLRPRATATPKVQPSNLRVLRGAPGAVSPFAGSVRLPAPTLSSSMNRGYPSSMGFPAAPPAAVGGIPPTVRMNSRMAALAPAIFGNAGMAAPRPSSPARPRTLAPAPVRPPRDLALPEPRPIRSGSVPQLPDPRNTQPETDSAPPQEPVAATPPVTPGAAPTTATREAPEPGTRDGDGSGSFIRIRPLSPEETSSGETSSGGAQSKASNHGSAAATTQPASGTTPARGPSLGEAHLHHQSAFNYWRQGDYVAAYQEYEYAAQLYRLIAARRGPDAAAAAEGLRAASQGMQASRGRR